MKMFYSDVLASSFPHGEDHLRSIGLTPTSVTTGSFAFRAVQGTFGGDRDSGQHRAGLGL
jgi:hypothetical protein